MKYLHTFLFSILFASFAWGEPSVVTLNADALEVVRALGGETAVAGVSELIQDEPTFWGDLTQKPSVGRWNAPDLEAIISLKPTFVLTYRQSPGPELERQLAPFGIRVLRLDFYRLSRFVEEVHQLGRALGREQAATNYADWWQSHLHTLQQRLRHVPSSPRVLIEGFGRFRTAGRGSGIHQMVTLAGGNNLASELPGTYAEYTSEWVVAHQPQVILKTVSVRDSYGHTDASFLTPHLTELLKRPLWSTLPAVRQKRVYLIGPDLGPGPRGLIGAMHMARWFHPGLFRDLNPEAVHADYLQRFQGLPLRGVFFL